MSGLPRDTQLVRAVARIAPGRRLLCMVASLLICMNSRDQGGPQPSAGAAVRMAVF